MKTPHFPVTAAVIEEMEALEADREIPEEVLEAFQDSLYDSLGG